MAKVIIPGGIESQGYLLTGNSLGKNNNKMAYNNMLSSKLIPEGAAECQTSNLT